MPVVDDSPAVVTRSDADRPATYRDVIAVREFRTLFAADLCSMAGDQVAAVALAVVLYTGSGSPLLAALGYATAYVPWLLGGPLLAAWAERLPGRSVMAGCDLARAALVGVAAIPGLPLPALGLLVLVAALLAPPFDAARSAVLPEILAGDRYPVGMSLRDALHQGAQLAGFVTGGALVAVVSARGALALDALSFGVSAVVVRRGLVRRPAAAGAPRRNLVAEMLAGWAAVRDTPVLLGTLSLGVVGAAYAIVPEAIATAYAGSLHAGSTAVGLLMAAVAAGSMVGGLAIARLAGPATRIRLIRPLALAGTLPLLAVLFRPGLAVSLALFAAVGLTGGYQVAANTLFARNVPPHLRARAFGLAVWAIYAGQTVAIVLSGLAAQFFAPATVVAGAGVIGAAAVLALRGGPALR